MTKHYAHDAGRNAQDFAIGISELLEVGARRIDLRWLVCKGYAEAIESGKGRRKGASREFSDRTIFVLTPKGEQFLRQLTASPHFDAVHHELRFGDTVIKRFRSPAPVQERILAEFEAQGWRQSIANPLSAGNEGSRQLREVVKSLNRNQHPHLIRFHCNGNYILWEAIEAKQDGRELPPPAS